MKKVLYGTTALVAAGLLANGAVAAEKIKLGVGGYFQFSAFAVSEDDGVGEPAANRRSYGVSREGEIIFNGKTTLDNGIEVGVQVQLEAETCGDQIDESFIWFEGSFGRINLGSENSAAYLMTYQAPGAFSLAGVNTPNHFYAQRPANNAARVLLTRPAITSDSEKLTYFTPRFSGFQLGVSYTPDNCEENGGGIAACGGTYSGAQLDNNAGQWSEVVELGANYVNKFDNVDVAISGTYGHGSDETPAVAGVVGTSEDREQWAFGVNLGISGWTIGGSYFHDDLGTNGAASLDDYTGYDLGVKYGWGPWSVGAVYGHVDVDYTSVGGGGSDEYSNVTLNGRYALGPGINLEAGVQFISFDSSSTALITAAGVPSTALGSSARGTVAGATAAAENDATVFFIGTAISF